MGTGYQLAFFFFFLSQVCVGAKSKTERAAIRLVKGQLQFMFG